MTAPSHLPAPTPAPGVIVSSRILAATPDEVFAACGDPARLARWWGPKGFTNTFHAFDFRPGGAWRFTMRGPDGAAYEMDHRFDQIVRPGRIVVRHIQPTHDFTLTITLTARARRTELTWEMRFADPAEGEKVRPFVVPANEENLDRLAAELAAPPSKS